MPPRDKQLSGLHSTTDANVFSSSEMDRHSYVGDHADRLDA